MPPIQPVSACISATGPTLPLARPEPSSGFRVPGTPDQAPTPEPAPLAATSGLTALLATQELADPRLRDRAARRHASATLDALAALQAALLGDAADATGQDALGRLAALANQPAPADPVLGGITRAVALRAAVELARRTPPRGAA